MDQSSRPTLSTDLADGHGDYRAVDKTAVVGLVLGLLASVALVHSALLLVSLLGVAVNLAALNRLRSDTSRGGRGLALLGLALSIFFTVVIPARIAATQWILVPQGRPIADQWFTYLREQQPERALMLSYPAQIRQGNEEALWFFYRHNDEAKERLEAMVRQPVVRSLMALGEQAKVRFYQADSITSHDGHVQIAYLYTVTYGEGAGKKTFFVRLLLDRNTAAPQGASPWEVYNFTGGVRPE